MEKETVTMFNLEAAFKALDEIEIPTAPKGRFQANRVNLHERLASKPAHERLVEDYFDINDTDDLEAAKEEREAEVAKAKLARIEKIVDLDAETEEDILPSYVGKVIIQCPQCMTLFYKDEADIEKSEETPDVVNINEICQHCGNSSGYTLVGKVGGIDETEAENFDLDIEEDEFALDFPEEGTEEIDAEGTGEAGEAMDEEEFDQDELDLDLPEEEEEAEEEEEEPVEESLHNSELLDKIEDKNELKTDIESEHLTLNESVEDAPACKIAFIDVSGSLEASKDAATTKAVAAGFKPEEIKYFDDPKFEDVLAAAKDGCEIAVFTNGDCKANCPELADLDNITIFESLEEDIADWYRKKFDKPASINTQQDWEERIVELETQLEDPNLPASKKDKIHKEIAQLEAKFAQQRDWEARHDSQTPTAEKEPVAAGVAESVNNSELLQKIEDKNELKTDIESENLTLNEDATDKLLDDLWSEPQPTVAETEANIEAITEATVLDDSTEKPATDEEDFDEFDEAFDAHVTAYLKEVYSNVESYTSTNCSMTGTKLVVEGLIRFNSGKEKVTKFTFDSSKRINGSLVFRGMNEGLTSEKSAFRLACRTESKKLITEGFGYKYTIEGSQVKGNTNK